MLFGTNVRGLATVLGLALMAATATAQSMRVSPGGVLVAGQTATISYSNPSLANTEVTIEVAGAFPAPAIQTVRIQLDAKGNGTGTWVVAAWSAATFNGPDVREVALPIRR